MREMKDSGIEWLGIIPKNWKVFKVKNIAKRKSDKNRPDEQVLSLYRELGIVIKSERDDNHNVTSENTDNYRYVEENDIVVNKMKAWQGSIAVSAYTGIVSPAYYVYKLTDESVYPWFVQYMLRCKAYLPEYRRLSGGIRLGQWDLSDENFKNIPLPIPATIEEQKQIVDYLDAKCSKIDEIIEKQQAIIEKLKEYKFSIITEAVTKGINPDVELKDSTIDMCEQIPVHWSISQNRYLFSLRDEKNYKPLEEVRLLSLYTDLGVFPHGEQEERGNKAVKAEGYKVVYENDIVVNIILAWMGAIGRSAYDGVTSPAYDIYKPNENVCSRYYHYLYRTKPFSAECYKYGRGIMAMRWRTYSSEFKSIKVPVPPYIEQCQIADYLDSKCEMLDKTIADRNKAIEKLQEYKKSLIYEVVTGKKEV